MSDALPPQVTDAKLPFDEQLQALAEWLRDSNDTTAVDAYINTFLELQLRTGQPKLAHEGALKAAQGKTPILPKKLLGADELEAKPYIYRSAIELALQAAGLHARARRDLLRPLFRSLLLWATHERTIVMNLLDAAHPSDEEMTQGLFQVVSEIGKVKDRAGDRLLTVIEAGCAEPRWLIALCRVLPARREAVQALMALEYAILPDPTELCQASWIEEPAAIDSLRTLRDNSHGFVRALINLTLAAAPGVISDDELIALLNDDGLPEWLREQVAAFLIYRNAHAPILSEITTRLLAGKVRYSFGEKLSHLQRHAAPQVVRVPVRTDDVCLLPVSQSIVSGPAVIRGDAVFLLIQTRQRFPAGDWRCASEEASLGVLSARGELRMVPLPVSLPSHKTGAAGAERAWAIEFLYEDKLLISLRVPFSNDHGWGTENFMLAWDGVETWHSVVRSDGEIKFQPITSVVNEFDLPSWGYGELILWKDKSGQLQSLNDGTPYHLDDWELSADVKKARDHATKSSRGWVPLPPPSYTKKRVGLCLGSGRKVLRFLQLEEVLRGKPDWPGLDETSLIGGVELAGGKVAAGVRSYEREPLYRLHDSVAILRKP